MTTAVVNAAVIVADAPPVDNLVISIPRVADGDASDDRSWFLDRPDRRFRARIGSGGVWLIRRRGEVLLRNFAAASSPAAAVVEVADDDPQIAVDWYRAAFPGWSSEQVLRRVRMVLS